MAYQPSDRLCRAISKNFMADFELQENLEVIEKRRKRVGSQLYKTRQQVKLQLETPTKRSESFQADRTAQRRRNEPDVFVLSACTTPAERKRRNIRSYNRLIRRLQETSDTHTEYHIDAREDPSEQVECSKNILSSASMQKRDSNSCAREDPHVTYQSKSGKNNFPCVSEIKHSLVLSPWT